MYASTKPALVGDTFGSQKNRERHSQICQSAGINPLLMMTETHQVETNFSYDDTSTGSSEHRYTQKTKAQHKHTG